MLWESLNLTSECLTQEAKVASLASRMEALEKENSTLKKDDQLQAAKEKLKTIAARSVEAF